MMMFECFVISYIGKYTNNAASFVFCRKITDWLFDTFASLLALETLKVAYFMSVFFFVCVC